MATCWAKCPDLFLYTKGKDVYLWRCNETTTTWMPMKTADFDDLGKVMDHQDLIGGKDAVFDWEESSYNDLVAYISSRRLLVNCRGLVIAELHQFDQDGKMDENGLLPFYIRSLDVLSLKPFGLRDRTIPSRTVQYLETEGKVAPVEDSNTTTITSSTGLDEGKRVADMEKQVAELKAANKTLKSDKEAAEKQVIKLTEANKTLKRDKEALKSDKEAAEQQANDLKDRNKSLAKDVAAQKTAAEKAQQERDAAERKAADLQTQFDSLVINEKKEVWMNKFSDQLGNWNIFDSLNTEIYHITLSAQRQRGFFTEDDDLTTNVRASYMHLVWLADANNAYIDVPRGTTGYSGYSAVRLVDLNPNKEKARFSILEWYRGTCNGDMYAIRERLPSTLRPQSPGDSSKLSAEEVISLNLLGS